MLNRYYLGRMRLSFERYISVPQSPEPLPLYEDLSGCCSELYQTAFVNIAQCEAVQATVFPKRPVFCALRLDPCDLNISFSAIGMGILASSTEFLS